MAYLFPTTNPPEAKKPAPFGTHQARESSPAVCHAGPHEPNPFAGCPGSAARTIPREGARTGPRQPVPGTTSSELRQWPVQLALLNPAAPYFRDAHLLISADCVPFAYPGFHAEYLKGRILIIFCPKLDQNIDNYIEKLAAIFTMHKIQSITILHMEVPCCSGMRYVVDQALAKSGAKIPVNEKTVTIEGKII